MSLAPDWTESGSGNILEELKWAEQISDQLWSSEITPRQLVEFVTRNAAQAIGMEDRAGRLAPGCYADLMVIADASGTAYEDLVAALPKDVMLTIVAGRPMYGNPAFMSQFSFLSATESVTVGGQPKTIAVAVPSHAIQDSGKTYATMESECAGAYAAISPKTCAYLPALQ